MSTFPRSASVVAVAFLIVAGLASAGCVSRKLAPTATAGDLHIVSIVADPNPVALYGQATVQATVDNPRGGALEYTWTAYRGSVVGDGATAHYISSYCCTGTDLIALVVRDDRGEQDTQIFSIFVLPGQP